MRSHKPKSSPSGVTHSAGLEVVALSALRTGERSVVVCVAAGRGILGRMTTLGFTPGAEVTVIQNFGRGPLIVRVRDARIALGRGQARKVFVRTRCK